MRAKNASKKMAKESEKKNKKGILDAHKRGQEDALMGMPPFPPKKNPHRQAYLNGYNEMTSHSRKNYE